MEKMIEFSQKAKVLVVVNTVRKAIELKKKLKEAGFQNAELLHSRKMSTFGLHRPDSLMVIKRFPWNAG